MDACIVFTQRCMDEIAGAVLPVQGPGCAIRRPIDIAGWRIKVLRKKIMRIIRRRIGAILCIGNLAKKKQKNIQGLVHLVVLIKNIFQLPSVFSGMHGSNDDGLDVPN